MNHIFKVVFNKATGAFVAVAEFAKGQGKKGSTVNNKAGVINYVNSKVTPLFGYSTLALAIALAINPAYAAGQFDNGTNKGIAISTDGKAKAKAETKINIAIGDSTDSGTEDGAIVIGNKAKAQAIDVAKPENTHNKTWHYNYENPYNSYYKASKGKNDIHTFINGGTKKEVVSSSVAIGDESHAQNGGVALGSKAKALLGEGRQLALGVAVGANAQSRGSGVAIGSSATTEKVNAVAIGRQSAAVGAASQAIGVTSAAKGDNSLAMGHSATAIGNRSISIGGSRSDQKYDHTNQSKAEGEDSIAIGSVSRAKQQSSIAFGDNAKALQENATGIGKYSTASGKSSLAIGDEAKAVMESAIAIGKGASSGASNGKIDEIRETAKDYEKARQAIFDQQEKINRMRNEGKAPESSEITEQENKLKELEAALEVKKKSYSDILIKSGEGYAKNTIAIGTESKAEREDAIAIGTNADASLKNSVALGAESTTSTKAEKVNDATVERKNGTSLEYSGFSGNKNVAEGDQVSVGAKGKERQIKHVAPGAVNSTSTDAINGSQLYAVADNLGNVANSTTEILGGNAKLNKDGTITKPTYNVYKGDTSPKQNGNGKVQFGNSATNVGDALTNLNKYVNQGFNVKDNAGNTKGIVTPSESVQFNNGNATTASVETEKDGVTAIKYDVNVDDKTIKVDDGKITANTSSLTTSEEGKVENPIDSNALIKAGDVAKAINQSGFKVTSDGNQATGSAKKDELVNPGDKVTYSAGKNITVKQSGDTTNPVFEFATADEVEFTNVKTNKLTSTGTTKLGDKFTVNENGNGNVTYTGNITEGNNIVNKAYVDNGRTKLEPGINTTLTPSTDASTGQTTYKVNANDTKVQGSDAVNVTGGDLNPTTNVRDYKVDLSQDTKDAIADGKKHNTVVGDGPVKVTDNNTNTNGGTEYKVSVGTDKSISTDGDVLSVNTDGTTITKDANTGAIKAVTAGFNPSTTTPGQVEAKTDTSLATAGDIAKAINQSGFNVIAAGNEKGAAKTLVKPGDTVTYAAGNNLEVVQEGSTFTFATAKDVKFDKITVNNGGPVINKDGINMGSKKITNLAPGEAGTDAVNKSQLDAIDKNTYFHVNDGKNAKKGNVNSNLGKLDETAGATGLNSIAAGKGARAKGVDSIVVGSGVAYTPRGIAIGKKATIVNMGGDASEGIAIGTNATSLDGSIYKSIPNGVSGIAIGKDTYANESTVDIGAKSTKNTVKGANRRAVTSVGADSYAAAHYSTVVGSYSDIKTDANVKAGGLFGFGGVRAQGIASTITGSLNSINADAKNGNGYQLDGAANLINGAGNQINHSNGSLILGSGNVISNSRQAKNLNPNNLTADTMTDSVKVNKLFREAELGSVGVMGGGNTVDNALYSNVQGVKNSLKGVTDGKESAFVSIDGYKNTATNVSNLTEQGSNNTVENANQNIVMGDNNTLVGDAEDRSQAKRNIILGFQDTKDKIGKNITNNQAIGSNVTVAENTTYSALLGDEAKVTGKGAVALGAYSDANRAALTAGAPTSTTATATDNTVYALEQAEQADKDAISATVKGDLAAVSVGNSDNTRQITNVAAGSEDSDAVNVSQLKAVSGVISKGFNITADNFSGEESEKGVQDNVQLGETVKYTSKDKNIVTTVSDNTIDFGLNSELTVGNDKNPGTIVVKGKDGKDGVTIDGKDGTIGLNGKDGANGTISVKNGVPGVDGKGVNGKDGITRVVVDDIEVATMKDGLKFAGNTGNTIAKKLNETLTVKGELDKDKNASGANLRVDSKDGNLNLVIAKDLTDIDSITVNNGGPVINKDGIDMNNKPITNVKSGLDNYTADNAPTPKANGLLNLSNSTNSVLDSNAATVGDLRNMGWVVSASGNEYSEQVKNANEVDFVGSGLATVTGKTEGNKRVITVDVNPQEVTNIAQLPVVYTTEDGDRVVKDPNSNNFYLAKNDGQPDYSKAPIEPENVIASMNDGLNSTKSPLFLSNVASNLPGTDAYKSIGNDFTNNIDVPDNVNKIKHNAATVDDVLNVGFNLQGNGKAVDFVKAYDTVNFVDGAGTKASVITTDNLTNKIAYNVNADNETVVVKGVDDKGNTVYQQKDGSFNTKVDGTGNTVDLAKVKDTQVAANTGDIIAETKNNIATGKTTFNEADKNKVATVGDVSNAINNSGFTVKANGDSGQMVNPGSAVDFISGDNIKVTRDGTNIKVATEDKVKFKDVVADTMTVKNKNSVAKGGDTNYVTEGSTSVVNGGDVYHAINTTDQQYTGDNGDVIVKRNPSQVLAIKGGAKTSTENNIKTVANEDGSIAIKLAETIDLGKKGSVKLGDTLVDNSGLTISSGANGPVKLTNEGLDNGNNVIANVAAGKKGTDAVNVDQLNKAAVASKTIVKAGKNTTVTGTPDKNTGAMTYVVDADSASVSAGSDAVTVAKGNRDDKGNTDYKVDLSAKTKDSLDKADSALQTVVTQIDGKDIKTIDKDNNTANFVTGTNIKLEDDGQGGIKVSTAADVTFENVTSDTMTVKKVGNSLNSVTNKKYVDDGRTQVKSSNGTVSVTKEDSGNGSIYDLSVDSQGVTNNSQLPVVYTDAKGNKVYKQPDGTFNTMVNGQGDVVNTGDIITSINSADGSTTKPTKLTNVADGTISADSTDAINGSQLYDTNTQVKGNKDNIAKGFNISADNGADDKVQLGDTVNYTSDDKNIVTTVRDNEIDFGLADKITVGDKGEGNPIDIDGNKGTIGGLTNKTFNSNNFVSGQAATEDQLAEVAKQAGQANKGWKLSVNGQKTNATDVKPTNVVDFSAADKNIVVSKDNNDIKVGLANDIEVDSLKAGDTTVNNNGIAIKAPANVQGRTDVSLTANGLNNGGNRITRVAPGVDGTDAVNVNQLKSLGYNLNNKIDKVGDEANAGVSSAMAMASLPQAYLPGKSMITGGMATYNGQGAVAVGLSKLSDNGKWVFKISGSADTEGNAGGAVGAGFHF